MSANFDHEDYFKLREPKAEKEEGRLNPNAAWGMQRRLRVLMEATHKCDVCEGPCDANDTITLDSGDYYVCSDNCADEAAENY